MTIILKTNPLTPDIDVIEKASIVLRNGGIVAFPTETVYGLGAVVFNENAVRKVFWAKMRPPDNPLIVHIADIEMLDRVSIDIPEKAYRLMKSLWPGPLTLILRKHPDIPKIVTGGLETVAVRMPAHPVAIELIRKTSHPIAAPSANLAGKPSPTMAEHVIRDLYGRIDVIIDAGETLYGVESTIIDVLRDPPVLLRPGAYTVEELERVLEVEVNIPDFARGLREAEIALAPGMRYRHYAPDTPVILIEPHMDEISTLINIVKATALRYIDEGKKVCVIAPREDLVEYTHLTPRVFLLDMGSRLNYFEIARNLYRILRLLDDLGCDIAVVEGIQEKGLGLTIMNRLRKASRAILRA